MHTVLLVEDSQPVRDMMRMNLEFEGFAVREAGNGREALSVLAEHPLPDVILLDLAMPGMTGYELLRKLRNEPGHPASRTPVLVLSAIADAPKEEISGAQGIFSKPVNFAELFSAIRRLCG